MDGFELNKVAAAVVLAGIIAIVSGKIADGLYHPVTTPEKPGYEVVVADTSSAGAGQAQQPEEINIGELLTAANSDSGKRVAKKCVACHSFDKGGKNLVGPNLWNIVGNQKAGVSGFKYSSALTSEGGTWGYEELFNFLNKPQKAVPGTIMSFRGIRKPNDVANLIAYLRDMSDNPTPLP